MDIYCDVSKMDLVMIHRFLSEESQWAKGIPISIVEKSLKNSLCFGGFIDNYQIAFARVISDFSTFANLVDVFVLPKHRGKGYGKKLIKSVIAHPELQGLRRFTLATADAHELYRQYGFTSLSKPKIFMQRYTPDIYLNRS